MTQPERDPAGETPPLEEANAPAAATSPGGPTSGSVRADPNGEDLASDAIGATAEAAGAEAAPSQKRKRRRRRRKKSRPDAISTDHAALDTGSPNTASPSSELESASASTQEVSAQDVSTQEVSAQDVSTQEVRAQDVSTPNSENDTKPADATQPSDYTEAIESRSEASAPAAPTTPSSKDLSRGQRSLQFCQQHAAALALDAETIPQLPPTNFEQLAALDELMSATRLDAVADSLGQPQTLQLLTDALVAAPTLERFNLCLKHSPDGAPVADDPKLLEMLRRLEVDDESAVVLWAQLVQRHVPQRQHVEWLLAASENKSLRRALEAQQQQLPSAWSPLLAHARTLQAVLIRGQTNQWGARALHQAIRSLLRSKADSLHQRAPAVRQRLLELALDLTLDKLETATVERHLDALGAGDDASGLALRQVSSWLAQARFTEAQARLEALAPKLPDRPEVGKWLKALAAPRFGDIALVKSRIKPPLAIKQGLRPGFALREQADVWLRVGSSSDALTFQEHAEVHRRAEIPGVTPLRHFGITRERRPYAAFARQGDNAKFALAPARGLDYALALQHAEQLLRLAYGLARAGVALPDADLGRLELSSSGQLWLVETWGIKSVAADVAQEKGLGIGREWLLALLDGSQHFELTPDQTDNLRHAADFATLRAVVDSLGRVYLWGG